MKLLRPGAVAALLAAAALSLPASAQIKPTGALEGLSVPKPEVDEIFNALGETVRVAYNNEGYAVMSYKMAQQEVGKNWILLNVGLTLRAGAKDYRMMRDAFSIKTPDGTILPLATQPEYASDPYLRALNQRAKMTKDPINYFPPGPNRPCAIKFFSDVEGPGLAYDYVEMSDTRACLGRLYFKVPGGIKTGQYWLNVKFANSTIQVPFRIFTEAEQKDFRKQWEDLAKALEDSYK